MRRWFAGLLIALIVAGLSSLGRARPVLASTCYGRFDYAFQVTGNADVFYNDPTCPPSYYFGWVGVNGQIQTPSHFPNLGGSSSNHSIGWVGMYFNDPVGPLGHSMVQEGWLAGCIGANGQALCADTSTGLLPYSETYFAAQDTYTVNPGGFSLTYSSAHIYRIEWDGVHCWNLYMNYSTFQDAMCDWPNPPTQVPRSGAAMAVSEIDSVNGHQVEMPTTIYGYGDPNTNNALRIRGGAGYVAWTPSLSTGGTLSWDERYDNPTTYVSPFYPDYEIEGCGSC
jgi:hypothetical protein